MNRQLLPSSLLGHVLCLILSVAMATGPSAAALAQTNAAAQAVRERAENLGGPGDAQPERTAQPRSGEREDRFGPPSAPVTAGAVDTSFVPSDAVAIVVLRPAQLLAAPMAQMFPVEVATAAGLKYLGFDPAEIEQAVAFAQMPSEDSPQPGYGVAVKFIKPFKGSAIPANLRAHAAPGELGGRKYLQSRDPMLPSLYASDAKTLVIAPEATLRQLVETKAEPKSGPVIDRALAAPAGSDLYVALDVAALQPLMAMGLMAASQQLPPGAPPEVQQFFEAPSLISAAELTVTISAAGSTSLVVHANDDPAAERLEQLIDTGLTLFQEQMKAKMTRDIAERAASEDPVEQAMAKYMERVSGQWGTAFRPTREGSQLTFFKIDGSNPQQAQLTQMAVIGILVALLLPAVQAAREAARRNESTNSMKQILLAFHMYHDGQRTLPANAIYSPDGQPLLSWRVAILPYIEEQALYNQFKLDEPWDSEHNRALIPRMPAVYANPNLVAEPGKTNYLAVVGEPCVFNGTSEGAGFRDIPDGTSKTILLVEADADKAVEWTKPADWQYDPSDPMAGLGGLRPNGWNAGLADGSVSFIDNGIDPVALNALFTRAGGEGMIETEPGPLRDRRAIPRTR